MAKVFCIIPARYESVRLYGKPLLKILGRPLIEWTWHNASEVSSFSDIFITTDSEKIVDTAKSFGAKVVITSSNHKSGTDRVAEAARKLNISGKDIIINIQSDEPLVSPVSVESLISSLSSSPSINMETLAYPSLKVEEFKDSNVVKVVVDSNDFALYFSRSPIPYWRRKKERDSTFMKHLGVYGYRMDFLQKFTALPPSSLEKIERLEQLRVLENGYKIKVIMSKSNSESVNTEKDLKDIEKLLKKGGS
jgi:3-deoxy-manno-octulosonate cytidylyltransferase (CMP-KDO synthetase)